MTSTWQGLGVSPGVVVAPALVLEKRRVGVFRVPLAAEKIDDEVQRFRDCLQESRRQLLAVKEGLRRQVGEHYACIFDAQLLLLEDPMFTGQVERRVREEGVNAEWALQETVVGVRELFRDLEDPYIRERVGEVEDIYERILLNLTGERSHDLSELEEDVVVVSHTLNPSDTASLNTDHVVAFVTDIGGPTSHTAILARSLEVPAVLGLRTISRDVETGDRLVVDGEAGLVLANPSSDVEAVYRRRHLEELERTRVYLATRELPSTTPDGAEISLRANIELPEELVSALEYGARGIGLYRSEFLYLETSPEMPTEEEHEKLYAMLARKVAPDPAVIRTIDLGGEKYYHEVLEPDETNPVLGLRGIRLSLHKRELFHAQLRGVLRASAQAGEEADLRLMFPLISGVGELEEGRRRLDQAREELLAEGIPFREDLPLGIMVEVPSAAQVADLLARRCDFLSIGTNDLIQYTLAVDRGNELVSYLYQPLHPAVLRMIRTIVEAAGECGRPVSLCGEMATNPLHAVLLVGLGLRSLSMNPVAVPRVKQALRRVPLSEAEDLARACLALETPEEIEGILREALEERIRELEEVDA